MNSFMAFIAINFGCIKSCIMFPMDRSCAETLMVYDAYDFG